jgi:hypothetical protein
VECPAPTEEGPAPGAASEPPDGVSIAFLSSMFTDIPPPGVNCSFFCTDFILNSFFAIAQNPDKSVSADYKIESERSSPAVYSISGDSDHNRVRFPNE